MNLPPVNRQSGWLKREMSRTTIGTALQAAVGALDAAASPQLDAQLLLGHVMGLGRAALLAHPEHILTPAQAAKFDSLIRQAAAGVPIPYLTGHRAFYLHDFLVTPDVLIPRPETEHLVEAALAWAHRHPADGEGLTLVDVGTGSGAIALSLAAALPAAAVHAIDISPAALEVARRNARRLAVTDVYFHQGDLLAALPEAVQPDLIAANLPYIPSDDLDALPVARHEPRLALNGGPDGLALIRRLLAQAVMRVGEAFCLLLEIGADQGAAVATLCRETFPGTAVRVIKDYAGHDRVVEVTP